MNKLIARAGLTALVVLSPLLAQAQDAGGPPPTLPTPPQDVNTVPEPGSMALVAMAFGASLALRRRRALRVADHA